MCVRSPSVIEFDYPFSQTTAEPAAPMTAVVQSVDRVSDTVVRLTLQSVGGGVTFLSGQYVNLTVPDSPAIRAYSFANQPGAPELVFYVRLIEGGAMAAYLLRRATAGDAISLRGPFGRFFLRDARRPMLMIAGGTGLAPMLSMLGHLAGVAERPSRIHLVYGANRPSNLFGLDEIARLQDLLGCLSVVVCVTTADSTWTGPVGLVSDIAATQDLNFGSLDAYLCGPPPMIEHAEALLTARGAMRERFFAERFVPAIF
jgi:benzoate/toluate 1,2-dioxygenase reductase subunit